MLKLPREALWLALLVAGVASAQEAAISGADFTKGSADTQLSALGRQAAASGRTVVVTAPTYWQAKAAAKIRAGAHGKPVEIRFSNGFYENVVVRTEAKAAPEPVTKAEPKPTAKPVRPISKTEAKPQPKPETKAATPRARAESQPIRPPANNEKPETAAAPIIVAPQKTMPPVAHPQPTAPKVTPSISAVPQVSHRPEVVPIPTAAANPTGIKSVLPATGMDSEAQQRLLANLNEGRPATGSLSEAQLQTGDQIYSDGNTLAVIRLEGLRRALYWLQGPVDLQRIQYSPEGNGRYQVTGTIDLKISASHRARAGSAHRVIVASEPPAGSAVRSRLERQYNDGQAITGRLDVKQLQQDDRLLLDGNAVVVVRRERNSMARYWLDGSIDLGQTGLQRTDTNIYQVVGNNLH
ncbi:MAG: hypothetical protein ABIY40_01605 [Rhodanobacteraceae bacterium]